MGEATMLAGFLLRNSGRSLLRSGLRTTARRGKSTVAPSTNATGVDAFVKADHSTSSLKIFHQTNILTMALTPIVFILPDIAPSMVTTAGNVVLGLALPLHAHIGMAGILTDYVPKVSKSALGPARLVL